MALPHFLARTMREAHDHARNEMGLAHGQYRVVTSVGTVKTLRNVDLYLVPGWDKRHDGFTMKAALRWTRMNVIDLSQGEAPAEQPEQPEQPEQAEQADGLEPPGAQPTLVEVVTDGEHSTNESLVAAVDEQIAEALSAEEAPRTRRRRCKECGELVEPDDVEAHKASHLPIED